MKNTNSNRKLFLFFEDESYLKNYSPIFNLLNELKIEFDYYSIFNSENSVNISKSNNLESLFKRVRYNLILCFLINDEFKVLERGRKAGIQIRIAFFDDGVIRKDFSNSLSSYFYKYASRIISNNEQFLSRSFKKYSNYSLKYRVANFDTLSVLKYELLAPLRDMNFNLENPLLKFLWQYVKKYNHYKYWERRYTILNKKNTSILHRLFFLYYIKKTDRIHNCSFGTNLSSGASFVTPPILPHGPNGIIVGHDSIVGREVTIYHQVTIMQGNVNIGNYVMLGAGSKVLPGVTIGDNVKIGANCVVTEDIPSNSTVVLQKPRILINNNEE